MLNAVFVLCIYMYYNILCQTKTAGLQVAAKWMEIIPQSFLKCTMQSSCVFIEVSSYNHKAIETHGIGTPASVLTTAR